MARVTRIQLLENMFQIHKISEDTYRCNSPHMCGVLAKNRLFGGQAVSQALRAVQEHLGRSISPSTMHYRFAAPGKGNIDLDYVVEVLESAVRVNVYQQTKQIGFCTIRVKKNLDCSVPQQLSDHLFPSLPLDLDHVPDPVSLSDMTSLAKEKGSVGVTADLLRKDIIYDIRPVEWGRESVTETPRNIIWSRLQRDSIHSIPSFCGHQAVLLLSDFLIIQIAEDIYWTFGFQMSTGASLAHSVRFHKTNDEIDPHGWFLYRVECESLGSNRAKLTATVYDESRMAVLTVIQEAMTQIQRKHKM